VRISEQMDYLVIFVVDLGIFKCSLSLHVQEAIERVVLELGHWGQYMESEQRNTTFLYKYSFFYPKRGTLKHNKQRVYLHMLLYFVSKS
jgi:hypothetical protein